MRYIPWLAVISSALAWLAILESRYSPFFLKRLNFGVRQIAAYYVGYSILKVIHLESTTIGRHYLLQLLVASHKSVRESASARLESCCAGSSC